MTDTAALISARLRSWPLRRCAVFANAVGGLVASRSGAMPDVADELAGLLNRVVIKKAVTECRVGVHGRNDLRREPERRDDPRHGPGRDDAAAATALVSPALPT